MPPKRFFKNKKKSPAKASEEGDQVKPKAKTKAKVKKAASTKAKKNIIKIDEVEGDHDVVRVLSWDIGIIHLAGCIFDYYPHRKKEKYVVRWWDNVSLLNASDNKTCQHCTSPAKFTAVIQEQAHWYCGKHNKKNYLEDLKKRIVPECNYDLKRKDRTCQIESCGKNALWEIKIGEKELQYCSVHKNSFIKQEEKGCALQPWKKKSSKSYGTLELKEQLFKKFDELPFLVQIDIVVIENQPVYKNPRMKAIQDTLVDYFIVRGKVDYEKTKSTLKIIKPFSPGNKIMIHPERSEKKLEGVKDKRKIYQITKALGIEYAKEFISHDKKSLEYLEKYPDKVDDLCDALLQGICYLHKNYDKDANIRSIKSQYGGHDVKTIKP